MGKMRSVQYMKTDAEVATVAMHHRIFKLLEWSEANRANLDGPVCMICEARKDQGHNPGCDLAKVIQETAP